MLPRSQRLSTRQFESVLEKGKVSHSPFFILRWVVSGDESTKNRGLSAVSVVVPKKIAKNAVDRNSLRRIVYDILYPIIPKISKKIKGIFFVKEPVLKAKKEDITADITSILEKAGLLGK